VTSNLLILAASNVLFPMSSLTFETDN